MPGAFRVILPSPSWTKELLQGSQETEKIFIVLGDHVVLLERGMFGIGTDQVKNDYIKRAMGSKCQGQGLYKDPYTNGVLAMDTDVETQLMVSDANVAAYGKQDKLYYSIGNVVTNTRVVNTAIVHNRSERLRQRMTSARDLIRVMAGCKKKAKDIKHCLKQCKKSHEEMKILDRFLEEVLYQRRSNVIDLFVGDTIRPHQYVVKYLDPLAKLGEEPDGGKAAWKQALLHRKRLSRKLTENDKAASSPDGTQLASLNLMYPESVDVFGKAPDQVEPAILCKEVRNVYLTMRSCVQLAKNADKVLKDWKERRESLETSTFKRRRITRQSKKIIAVEKKDIPTCVACGIGFGEYEEDVQPGTVVDVLKFDCCCKNAMVHRGCCEKLLTAGPLNACPICKTPLAQRMGINSPVGKMCIVPCRKNIGKCNLQGNVGVEKPFYMVFIKCDEGRLDVFSENAFMPYPSALMVFYVPYNKKGHKIVECLVQMWKLHRLLYMKKLDKSFSYCYRVSVSQCPCLDHIDEDVYCDTLLDQCRKELMH